MAKQTPKNSLINFSGAELLLRTMTASINWILPVEANTQCPRQIVGFSFSGLLLRIESSLDYQRDRDYSRRARQNLVADSSVDHSVVVIDTHNDLECLRPAEHLLTYFREFSKTALISVLARPRRPLRMSPNLSPGARLGHYEIRSKIGAGGMGEVYLAQDTKLDRKVALKILPADLAANQDRMRRFVQEAKAAAALNHPNIAHIYEIGESGGINFMAMEFVDGVTLGEKIHGERTELKKLLNVINGDTNERE